jgi:ArsR family transcriptional regulator
MELATAQSLDAAAGLIKALADPVRLRLLNLLTGNREVCVCHLHEALNLPQPTVSRHLSHLRRSGLVAGRKDGYWVYYRLAQPSSGLHWCLLGSVLTSLGNIETLRSDVERLARLTECGKATPDKRPGTKA